ncbi:MAG: hypothetical protein WBA74_14225 [Cyclobacteriaceae bacterium]
MKAASLVEIKKVLKTMDEEEMMACCLRLAKFKKDNKELLTYLLFEEKDEGSYIALIKEDIDFAFEEINTNHIYYAKKGVRKILRNVNKYIRYSGKKQTEVEILIYFCETLKKSGIRYRSSTILNNLYQNQVKKIKKALDTLHEDLRFDYQETVESL